MTIFSVEDKKFRTKNTAVNTKILGSPDSGNQSLMLLAKYIKIAPAQHSPHCK